MLLEPGGRLGGGIRVVALSLDSKGVSGFLQLRLSPLPPFPPRPPRVGFRLRNHSQGGLPSTAPRLNASLQALDVGGMWASRGS